MKSVTATDNTPSQKSGRKGTNSVGVELEGR